MMGQHFGIDLGRGWRGPGCRARRRRCARRGRRSGCAQWPSVMGPWLGCEGGCDGKIRGERILGLGIRFRVKNMIIYRVDYNGYELLSLRIMGIGSN